MILLIGQSGRSHDSMPDATRPNTDAEAKLKPHNRGEQEDDPVPVGGGCGSQGLARLKHASTTHRMLRGKGFADC
jgi:hypothetical protein